MSLNEIYYWLEMFAGFVKGVFLFWTNVMHYLTVVIKIVCALPGILVRSVIEAIPYGLAAGAIYILCELGVLAWQKLSQRRAKSLEVPKEQCAAVEGPAPDFSLN